MGTARQSHWLGPVISAVLAASGCTSIERAASTTRGQRVDAELTHAFTIVERQARACFRVMGGLGGIEVQAVLDSTAGTGAVEVFEIGLQGAVPFDASTLSRRVTLQRVDERHTTITVSGTNPRRVHTLARVIPLWIGGQAGCWPP